MTAALSPKRGERCATCGHPKYMHGLGGCGFGEKRPYCICIAFIARSGGSAGEEQKQ